MHSKLAGSSAERVKFGREMEMTWTQRASTLEPQLWALLAKVGYTSPSLFEKHERPYHPGDCSGGRSDFV